METRHLGCPNCGAPLDVPLGEVEALCEFCRSKLRFIPEDNELEVVRTREEMKHRERVAVEKQILRNKLEKEEMDRWRKTASKVAIAAIPIIGRTAGIQLRGSRRRRMRGVWLSRTHRRTDRRRRSDRTLG